MVRVSKGIGKVIGALLWGSNQVCTKPNRSFAFRTDPPRSGVWIYRRSIACKWVGAFTGLGLILETTLCPPHLSAIPVGTSLNFFSTFLRKVANV